MKTIASLAALAAAFLVAPVNAQGTPDTGRSMVVRTADLDLSSARGLASFDRRLHRAAVAVCGRAPDFDVAGRNDARRCVAKAKAAAAPQVTALLAASRHGTEMVAAQ